MVEDASAQIEALYGAYYDELLSFVKRRQLVPYDEAEDLVAQAFCKALAAICEGNGPRISPRAWLYRIVRNLAIDWRRATRRQGWLIDLDDLPPWLMVGVEGPDVEQVWMRIVYAAAVRQMECLTPPQRAVMRMVWVDGMSAEQIAAVIGKKPGAVKALMHRGLMNLRDSMAYMREENRDARGDETAVRGRGQCAAPPAAVDLDLPAGQRDFVLESDAGQGALCAVGSGAAPLAADAVCDG